VRVLSDGFQHISRLGDVRQINLGANFIGDRARPRLLRGGRLPQRSKVLSHPLCFVDLDGTGMGLLFGDANGW
jgi:hypothetical protein